MSETITVTGNIATEPQQRIIGDDVSVTSFRVASTHRRFDQQSRAWVDAYTNYYSVSAFRSLGRNAFASLRLGDRVVVSGRLRLKEWDNGTRRGTNAEIDAESIGHDLLWGVTTFQRGGADQRGGAQPARSTPDDHPSSPGASEPRSEDAAVPAARFEDASATDAWSLPSAQPLAVGEVPF